MEFKITGKALIDEFRNYLSLGLEVFAWILSIPSEICLILADWIKVKNKV